MTLSVATAQPLNRKYLRAIFDYGGVVPEDQEGSPSDASKKAYLRTGDIILVHLTHVNGWADGTVLNTGRRGWFPANFCEPYDHEYVRYFFHGLTNIWTASSKDNSTSSWNSSRKDEIQSLVFGIRYALEKTDCLRRGSSAVQAAPFLHRLRRNLLSHLTTLSGCADNLIELASTSIDAAAWSTLTEGYIQQAFRVAIKLVRFIDEWSSKIRGEHLPSRDDSPVSPVSPASTVSISRLSCWDFMLSIDTGMHGQLQLSKTLSDQDQPATPITQRDSVLESPRKEEGSPHSSDEQRSSESLEQAQGSEEYRSIDLSSPTSPMQNSTVSGYGSHLLHSERQQPKPLFRISRDLSISHLDGSHETSENSSCIGSLRSCRTSSTGATTPESVQVDMCGKTWEFPVPGSLETPSLRAYTDELVLDEEGKVIGGTQLALVMSLIYGPAGEDPNHVRSFFLCFRSFMSAKDLAEILIKQYCSPDVRYGSCDGHRARISALARLWMRGYWDRAADTVALDLLQAVCESGDRPMGRSRSLSEDLTAIRSADSAIAIAPCSGLAYLDLFVAMSSQKQRYSLPSELCNVQPVYLKMNMHGKSRILDMNAVDLAKQLTLMSAGLFSLIRPSDLLSAVSDKVDSQSPRLRVISKFSTDVTMFVSYSIVAVDDLETRTAILAHWITIARICLSMDNYDSLMAIMCALSSAAVSRLHRTWSELTPYVTDLFAELKDITDVSKNFSNLRQCFRAAKGPCVPFLGIFLQDLIFAEAGNPSTREMRLGEDEDATADVVNFDKYRRLGSIVEGVMMLQKPYSIKEIRNVQHWLKVELEMAQQRSKDGNHLYDQSERVEPRGDSSPVSKSGARMRRMFSDTRMRGGSDVSIIGERYGKSSRSSRLKSKR